jgi:hypothetical protein
LGIFAVLGSSVLCFFVSFRAFRGKFLKSKIAALAAGILLLTTKSVFLPKPPCAFVPLAVKILQIWVFSRYLEAVYFPFRVFSRLSRLNFLKVKLLPWP